MSQSHRDRSSSQASQSTKHRSKSNKRGSNKPRRSVPQFYVPQQRGKAKACTVHYIDYDFVPPNLGEPPLSAGFTSDNGSASLSSAESPYDAMRNTVQTAINSAKNFDIEKIFTLNTLRRNKPPKGDEPQDPSVLPATSVLNLDPPKDGGGASEGKGDDRPTGAMAGNEDDEEYQVEEEEAERIISQEDAELIISQGLSVQEMSAVAYQTKKSITEQMRELQICIMERAAKKVEPKDLLNRFRREGYFNYIYDQDARTTTSGTMNGTKKDTLYVIIGLTRKAKIHE